MAREAPRTAALLWLATVVLVTLNLRPFLTAVGPLGQTIQASTGMDLSALAWLTLLPMALMGAGAWAAPAALRRLGARACVAGALLLVAPLVGTHAGDMIGEIALAIEMGADAVDIGKTIHPHPTLGESIGMAAEVAHGSCTDVPPARK